MGYRLLGEIMVEDRVLTPDQVDTVLGYQERDDKPFGDIAVERFGVSKHDIWQSRAKQMQSTLHVVDLEKFNEDRTAQGLVSKTEAALYWVLPVKFKRGVLTLATSAAHLVQAMPYFRGNLKCPTRFVLAPPGPLRDRISKAYGVSTTAYTTYDLGGSSVVSRSGSLGAEGEVDRRRERASATRRLREVYGIGEQASNGLVESRCECCQQRMRVPAFLTGYRIGCGACGSPTRIIGEKVTSERSTPEDDAGQARRVRPGRARRADPQPRPESTPPPADDKLKFFCYQCGHRLAVQAGLAGRKVRCCHCNEVVRAPEKSSSGGAGKDNGKPAPAASTRSRRSETKSKPARPAVDDDEMLSLPEEKPHPRMDSTAGLIRSGEDDDSWFPVRMVT